MMWFYKHGDQEIGPIGKDDLQALIHTKRVSLDTMVRREDKNEWTPLAELVRNKAEHPKQTSRSTDSTAHSLNEDSPASPTPQEIYPEKIPLQFNGTGGEYFKIWIVNILLSIITLGLYSAWAKVRRKQYLYGNTLVAGSVFRYLANPVQILKGRVIIFALFIVYSIFVEIFPPIAAIFGLIFLFILPWLVVRSLAFNARNTAIRNIRFNFTGSYSQAAKAYVLYPFLSILTLGALYPFALFRQKKFVVENTAYGTTPFRFTATAKDYYRMIWKFLIPMIIFLALFILVAVFMPPVTVVVSLLMYLYTLAYFGVASSNLFFNNSVLSKHGFRADMKVKEYAVILFTNTLATVGTIGLFYPFAQIRAIKYKTEKLALVAGSDFDQFIAAELEETNAVGDELSDFMDFDFGL